MSQSDEIMQALERAMSKLHQIWNRLGIGAAQKEERNTTVMQHLQHLLDEMVEEEVYLEKQIIERVENYTDEVKQLTIELGLPEFKKSTSEMTVLQKERLMRTEAETLKKEKQERLKILKKLQSDDQLLCDAMCMTPYYIPSGTTPSGEQLDALREHVRNLTTEKEKRFQCFLRKKKEISDLMMEMDRSPETDFERDVLREDENDFILSSDNMRGIEALLNELISSKAKLEKKVTQLWDRLRTLWERLETPQEEMEKFCRETSGFKTKALESLQTEIRRCEKLKLQHIQRFVEGMKKELIKWWDKCFYSEQQRNEFHCLNDDDYSEDLLDRFEKEVTNVKAHYECNKEILDKISSWHELFNQMIEFDKKANDPNRFFHDRGGKLLLEEKARKKLMKDLPKLEDKVKEEVQEWERDHGRQFLLAGVPFLQYLEQTWHDYQETKIKEKEERQKAKTRLMEEEMIFGSKPSTPVKRRLQTGNTPTKTPKFRKVNESRTPSSCSRIQHSTMFASPHGRAPLSTSKYPTASKVISSASKMTPGSRQRRRSNRLVRKVLGEQNAGTNETNIFSHTTVSGCGNKANVVDSGGNVSIASTGSYQDFATGLNPSSRPNCRSSILPPLSGPGRIMDHRL